MCTGPTKTAVVTSTIGIDIEKNNPARRHRVALEAATSPPSTARDSQCSRGRHAPAHTTLVSWWRALADTTRT
jgi:hypothetical protein